MTDDTILEETHTEAPVTEQPGASASPGEQQPVAQPAPAREAPPAPQDRSGWVPIDAHLNEREKRQALQRRLDEAEQRERERVAREQEANAQIPDYITDPEGYNAYWKRVVADQVKAARAEAANEARQEAFNIRVTFSRKSLLKEIGQEKFAEFFEWTKTQPQEVIAEWNDSVDPFGDAYDAMQAEQRSRRASTVLQTLGDKSLDEFLEEQKQAWLAANGGGEAVAPQREVTRAPNGQFAPSQQQPKHRPPNLAVVQGASAPTPTDSEGGYERLFKKG